GRRAGFGGDALGRLFDTGQVARHQVDLGSRARQLFGDGEAQSPACAGHDRALPQQSLEFHQPFHHLPPRSSGFSTGVTFMSRLMPRARPISTLPGPTSRASLQSSVSAFCIDSTQRTGDVSCLSSRSRMAEGSETGSACTLLMSGTLGAEKAALASPSRRPGTANSISGEWKAPLTARRTTFLAPAA